MNLPRTSTGMRELAGRCREIQLGRPRAVRACVMAGRPRIHDDLYLELEMLRHAQEQCREAEYRVWEHVKSRSPELAALLLDFWKNDEVALARWLCARRGDMSPAELVERGRVKEVIAQVKWAASSAYV